MRDTGAIPSEAWDARLRSGGEAGIRVRVRHGFVDQPLPAGGYDLAVERLSYEASEGRLVRGKISLTIADWLTRSEAAALLAPSLADLVVTIYLGGVGMDLGTFRITSASRSRGHAWTVEADDYGRVLVDSRLVRPVSVGVGTNVLAAMSTLVTAGVPGMITSTSGAPGSVTTAADLVFERDRGQALEDLATSIGCEWYVSASNQVIVRTVPKVNAATPDWTIDPGPTGVLTDVGEVWSTDRLYNAVVASGTEAASGVSAVVYQTTGPYAWSSTFRRPRFYSSPSITTAAQAETAARSILARSPILSEGITVSSVVNPALEVGDQVLVKIPAESFLLPGGGVEMTTTDVRRIVTGVSWSWPPTEPMKVSTRGAADVAVVSNVGSLA